MKILILLLSLMISITSVEAHEVDNHFNRVSFSTSAEREVENDLLVANLYSEHQAQQQKDVSDHVNKATTWALDKSNKVSGVKVQTTQYSTSPIYTKRIISGWRARQGIRLESTDSAVLGTLIGELQERLLVGSINYGVSKKSRDKVEEALTAEALAKFTKRANVITHELDRNSYQIVEIQVNTQGGQPVPINYMAKGLGRSDSKVTAAAIEAGVQKITVSITGTIEMNQPQ